jgi:tRNA threonylcarbamoyl adenosine modification protein (Sua5/YciO/YrdC/YwlC family)
MERTRGIAEAVSAVRRGELIVLPTDTVYGIGADAFTPAAVNALLEAKGRGRDMPAPVLVGSVRAAQALVEDFGTYGQDLVDEFWPGALTLVCRANSTLAWDLGESKGTVAIRMPLHQLTLELLKETGPMAVSSANRAGAPPARTADDAETQLGDSVEIYLDDGPSGDEAPSSIVDLTGAVPRLLRAGAIPEARLREVCGVLLSDEDEPPAASGAPADAETEKSAKADENAGTEGSAKADESAETDSAEEDGSAETERPAKAAESAKAGESGKAAESAKADESGKAEADEKEAAKAERSGDADKDAQ